MLSNDLFKRTLPLQLTLQTETFPVSLLCRHSRFQRNHYSPESKRENHVSDLTVHLVLLDSLLAELLTQEEFHLHQ